ncbi:nucleoside hydrolase [Stagnihabitans tardus]|uniref:Nucleoside hydrolase n=1 Tax=Stagnihabitans tardus TaxID=2699202 RepID=A0AAE5BXJ9_9RHOB|nr:nucleoside hydrolase [Stagnihabitans tardus]NBZ90094.1 nucleoside hydrolase [Stagnihabitans tardus]
MHKVIFDTDPGVDDAMALLFLARHPEIQLLGVTTVFGNAAIEVTTRNALFLREAFGFDAPVAQGAGRCFDPNRGTGHFPHMIHGANGLGDIQLPEPAHRRPLDHDDAAGFIIDTVRANPGEVSIIAVGRMTNLALALRRDPGIAGLVKDVTLMGGAFFVPGNVTPAAEANIHGDPEAADLVLTAPWKVYVVGLDVTGQTQMSRPELAALAPKSQALTLLDALSQRYIDFYDALIPDAMLVHDTCACVHLVRPDLFTRTEGAMRVVCEGIATGQTILKPQGRPFPPGDWDGLPVQAAVTGVQSAAVMALVAETLAL